MNLEQLEEIGLTKGEIKVYTALLELGDATKTPIANKSGVSPGKVYDVLERLTKKGLVSTIKKGSVKNFRVANPKSLKNLIKIKEQKIKKESTVVDNLLPSLIEKYNKNNSTTHAEVFSGWKGLRTIYDELIFTLKKGETDYVFGATPGKNLEQTVSFFSRFNQARYKKGIKLKIIYARSGREVSKQYITNKKLDQIRYLEFQTPSEINIYKNKVIIVIWTELPVAVVITSEEAADSFKQYFDKMWSLAKP